MTETGMKDKIVSGLFWKLVENGGAQGIQALISILLARLLSPEEYGVISIITIFITVINVIVQNGFSTALIQKKDTDSIDFSSVFYFDLLVALIMYGGLFLAAPGIGDFYMDASMTAVIRVFGIVLFPGAVISVQTAYVARKMEFKGLCKATMLAVVLSGAVSITMAYGGMGVWALAGQQIVYYFSLMAALFFCITWKPERLFSLNRLKTMFAFGWKLLCASLIDTLFTNLHGLIMGKIYSKTALGNYSRGEQFPKLVVTSLGASIQSVLLPVFSKNQHDVGQVRNMVRRSIRISSFLILPMLCGMFGVADTMVLALLGEKWMVCVPYLRIMCVAYCFYPIHITNLQAINALGRSDIFLKLELVKKAIGLVALLIGIQYSALVMIGMKAVVDFLCIFINAWPNKKLLGYSIMDQWKDILPSMMLSLVMGAAVYVIQFVLPGLWLKLFLQIVAGMIIYGGIARLFHMESFEYLAGLIKEKIS